MAGFGRAGVSAAAERGNANRGNLRDSDEITAVADLGLATFGDRIWTAAILTQRMPSSASLDEKIG
jgi:hypothetical protein